MEQHDSDHGASETPGSEPRSDTDALRQSEERMRMMIEAVRDYAIFMLEPDGRVASWNTGAQRLKGYAADEIIGRHFSTFYTEPDRLHGHPDHELRLAKSEGRYEEEGWRVRKDGTQFWANVVITPVFDGRGRHLGFAKVTRDVTERHASEEKIRASEERFRLLVDSVRDYGIFMLDEQGRVSSWNLGAQRIKGYAADEIIGKSFTIFYPEEARARQHPQKELALALQHGSYSEEGWRLRKDGSRFWASVVITSVYDALGRHVGFSKVTRDLTERRAAEEQLRALNDELEKRVQERTTALRLANRELEAFSYSVSHDLRAPLRALDGFSRLLLDQAGASLSAQHRDYLRRIRAAAIKMAELTDAMMMLARLTKSPIQRRAVDVSALSLEIAAELRASESHDVELAVAPGLEVEADPKLLRTALHNLLRNAWKFTRHAPHPRIEIGTLEHEGERALFVRDNGVGYDPALQAKLFVPFQRLHRVQEYEGTGIGLATVHRIIERHGGRVWSEGKPNHGATFYFTLAGRHVA